MTDSNNRGLRAVRPADQASARALCTRAVHAGEADDRPARPLTDPIHQTTVYAFGDSAEADAFVAAGGAVYARDGLPNACALERAVADLEGAEEAVAVASGMAATAQTLFAFLAAGDHVVAAAGCYRDTRALLTEQFARFGVGSTFLDLEDAAALGAAITPRTRLVLAETIANPAMLLADLPAIARTVHERGALFCVDNTFATPALCRPLEHGADLVLHSAGKFLGGHHDVTAGVVAGPRRLLGRIRRGAYLLGPTLAPMDAWLALRGIKTLQARMDWVSRSAATIAAFLADHPAVAAVRYPGRPAPGRAALTHRLLPDGAGGLLAFDLTGGPCAADRFVRSLRAIPYAPTVGGTSTILSYPPQPECLDGDGLPVRSPYRSATVRLSVGLEATADLLMDLGQALDGLARVAPLSQAEAWSYQI